MEMLDPTRHVFLPPPKGLGFHVAVYDPVRKILSSRVNKNSCMHGWDIMYLRTIKICTVRDCSEFLVRGVVLYGKSARKKRIPPPSESP